MATITVGCKLPNGLIITCGGKSATLAGANSSRIVGGYGLTAVDKDFFEAWTKEYASFAPLKHGLIFAQEKPASAEAQAKEQAEVKSGLEPLPKDRPGNGLKAENYEGMPADKDG